jgi:uncharacterized protein involved in exopolysaccharide biosynthesis
MSATPKQPLAPDDLLRIAVRFRWRFIFPAFLVATAVLAAGLILPRKYKAEAVFERRTDVVLSDIIHRSGPVTGQDSRQSLVEELTGQAAVDALRDALRSQPPLRAVDNFLAADVQTTYTEIARRVTVTFDVSGSDLDRIRVTYLCEDPALAQIITNTLVSNYIAQTQRRMEDHLRESLHFLEDEVQRNRALIEEMENKKLAYEIDHAALLPDQPANINSQLNEAQTTLTALRHQLESARLRAESLRQCLAATPETSPSTVTLRNPDLDRGQQHLRDLRDQLAHMLGPLKMTDKHPDVAALKEQIQAAEQDMSQTPAEVTTEKQVGSNPKHAELDLLLAGTTAEIGALEHQMAQAQAQVDALSARSAEVFPARSECMKLGRSVDEARRQLAFWEDNLRRVQMALTAEAGKRGVQLDFVRPSQVASTPASPSLPQVALAALGLAVLAGGLGVVYAYRTDDTCAGGEQLAEACGLPLIGSVGPLWSRREKHLRLLRRAVLTPLNAGAMLAVLLGLSALLYLQLEKPGHAYPTTPAAASHVSGGAAPSVPAGAAPSRGPQE